MKIERPREPVEPFAPPNDPVFQHLLSEAAVSGAIPVYGIVISTARLIAFDAGHHPERMGPGPKILESLLQRWRDGAPPQPWVYPRGDIFVVSDDYFALAAIRAAKVETIACQCLGEPKTENVISAQGPLPQDWVRQAIGIKAH